MRARSAARVAVVIALVSNVPIEASAEETEMVIRVNCHSAGVREARCIHGIWEEDLALGTGVWKSKLE